MDMELGEVWGTLLQGEALACFRQLQEENNLGMLLGVVKRINYIRDIIRNDEEEASIFDFFLSGVPLPLSGAE